MMQKICFPEPAVWPDLMSRPAISVRKLEKVVDEIFDKVRNEGDGALIRYTEQFDGTRLQALKIDEETIRDSVISLDQELIQAIHTAKANIERFHLYQKGRPKVVETSEGVRCWRESRAIERVGLYIPGGSAPLFSSVLMLAIPARLAGCKEVILCTPPDREGKVHPAILYTAYITGVTSVFCVGGAQAIAAMTFGTGTIPGVFKIFGPGNQYVTAAKMKATEYGVAIDMPAGPSEVLIIADKTADPDFVAADLLSQAEHGPDSQVILLSDDEAFTNSTIQALNRQLPLLPRKETATEALENSKAIVLKTLNECMRFSNLYGPEHLIIAAANPKKHAERVTSAGSVFLGNYSCESAGDYASGTNHTLPTNGFAHSFSGVSVDSFVKKITFQELTKAGLENIGPAVVAMAEAEGLKAHANAVTIRLK